MNHKAHKVAEGMTLIELLVSLGVLAVISVAFATILSQSQRVVDRSNALMRANATASAISQTLRDDLARFCPQGFLAVYDPNPADPSNNLVFTALGPFTSLTDPTITANAARIDYGWTDWGNTDPNDDLVWRRAILLTGTTVPYTGPPDVLDDDIDPIVWLGRYDSTSPVYVDPSPELATYCQTPNPVTFPRRDQDVTAGNVDDLWPLLARPVTAFSVSWWDTSAAPPVWNPADQFWTATNFAGGGGPAAIKVNFTLRTGSKPGEELDYEVICPLRP
jgi:prepilin-type N-terminal cleavage/methylation domain-containing protein